MVCVTIVVVTITVVTVSIVDVDAVVTVDVTDVLISTDGWMAEVGVGFYLYKHKIIRRNRVILQSFSFTLDVSSSSDDVDR